MDADPEERHNLESGNREKVREMVALLRRLVEEGRSTPGEHQRNDAAVDIWKLDTMPAVDSSALDDY